MLWFKAFHIISVVAWFAGLFYLPRLYVYHAVCEDSISLGRFKIMEWRLYYAIMWPAGIMTSLLGAVLICAAPLFYLRAPWMHAKLSLVLLLWGYHLYCGHLLKKFATDSNLHSQRFYRYLNELPTLLLIAIIILVVVKPF